MAATKYQVLVGASWPPAGGFEAWREASDSDSDDGGGFGAGRGRSWKKREVSAYDIESEPEDLCSYVPPWPQPQVARPLVRSLVAHNAPRLLKVDPLTDSIIKRNLEVQAQMATAQKAVVDASLVEKTAAAAHKTEADSQAGVSAWARTETKKMYLKRLATEHEAAITKRKTAEAAFEKLAKETFSVREIVRLQVEQEKSMKRQRELEDKLMESYYGPVTPVKTATDIWGQYDPAEKEETLADGRVRFRMREGTDMDKLARALSAGGHESIETDGLDLYVLVASLE